MTNSGYVPRFKCYDNLQSGKIIFYQSKIQSLMQNVLFEDINLITLSSRPPDLDGIKWSNQVNPFSAIDSHGVDGWKINDVYMENIQGYGMFIDQVDINTEIEFSEFNNVEKAIHWQNTKSGKFYVLLYKHIVSPLWSTLSLCSAKTYNLEPNRIGYWFNYEWSEKNEFVISCKTTFQASDGYRVRIIASCRSCRNLNIPIFSVFNTQNSEQIDSYEDKYVSCDFIFHSF